MSPSYEGPTTKIREEDGISAEVGAGSAPRCYTLVEFISSAAIGALGMTVLGKGQIDTGMQACRILTGPWTANGQFVFLDLVIGT